MLSRLGKEMHVASGTVRNDFTRDELLEIVENVSEYVCRRVLVVA